MFGLKKIISILVYWLNAFLIVIKICSVNISVILICNRTGGDKCNSEKLIDILPNPIDTMGAAELNHFFKNGSKYLQDR